MSVTGEFRIFYLCVFYLKTSILKYTIALLCLLLHKSANFSLKITQIEDVADAEKIVLSMEEVTHSRDFMLCTSSLYIFTVIKSIWKARKDEKGIPKFSQKNCKTEPLYRLYTGCEYNIKMDITEI